jgi:Fe-S cluster assembly protein SufB
MSTNDKTFHDLAQQDYKWGFVTDVAEEKIPRGLNEGIVRLISAKKNEPEFMLEWRLKAFRHWLTLEKAEAEPTWANIHYPPIDYQNIFYYSAPPKRATVNSLDDIDPEILKTYEKLGIPLTEQKRLAGVAVDAVFDSVSVATTFQGKLAEMGVIFRCGEEPPRAHQDIPGQRGALYRQLLCRAERRGVQRRVFRLRAQGRALPHGAFHLFPH